MGYLACSKLFTCGPGHDQPVMGNLQMLKGEVILFHAIFYFQTSEQLNMPITACCFNSKGNIFAYTSSYDWSKVCTVDS